MNEMEIRQNLAAQRKAMMLAQARLIDAQRKQVLEAIDRAAGILGGARQQVEILTTLASSLLSELADEQSQDD